MHPHKVPDVGRGNSPKADWFNCWVVPCINISFCSVWFCRCSQEFSAAVGLHRLLSPTGGGIWILLPRRHGRRCFVSLWSKGAQVYPPLSKSLALCVEILCLPETTHPSGTSHAWKYPLLCQPYSGSLSIT